MEDKKRIDPDDDQPYTYKELFAYYRAKYSKKDIDYYWASQCLPVNVVLSAESQELPDVPSEDSVPDSSIRPAVACAWAKQGICKKGSTALLLAPGKGMALGSFQKFAISDHMEPFMREVLRIIEEDAGLHSYHLRIVPWLAGDGTALGGPGGRPTHRADIERILEDAEGFGAMAASSGFLVFVAGGIKRERKVPFVEGMDELGPISYTDASGKLIEVPDVTQKDVLVLGQEVDSLACCGMDWQGRPCLVAAMSPACPAAQAAGVLGQVRRQSQLNAKELAALWGTIGKAVQLHGCFEDIRVNAGSYQNVAHLHVKIFFETATYDSVWKGSSVYQKLRNARDVRRHRNPIGSGRTAGKANM